MKKLLIIAGAVVAVVIVAALVAPYFVSADTLKAQILARVRDATGRDLKIDGPLSLGFFPNVKVEAGQVTLANAPGAAAPAMAKLKQLDLVVRLFPLLSGRIEVERLVLVEPAMDLEIDAQGRPSWSFAESGAALPAAAAGAVPPKNPSMMGLAALSRLQVRDVTIQNGDIVLLDRRTNRREELQQVAVTLSAPSLDAPFTVDGTALWRGQKIAFSAKLDRTGALMQPAGKSALTGSLTATAVSLKFAGTVTNTGSGGNYGLAFDGKTELAVPSVRDLVSWSGENIVLPKHGFGALAASGTVHAENGVAKFSDGNFSLDTVKATGALTLDATGARLSAAGTLATGMLDLNPYLPPPVPGWSTETFDTAVLRQVDAELTVDAQGAKYRKLQIGKSAAVIHLRDGKLTLDVSDVSLYRGNAKGTVRLDAAGPAAALTLDGAMSGVDIGALLRDAGGGASIAGSGSFTLSGTARGNSERDLVSTLAGKANFRVTNGSLGGVDLGGMLKNSTSSFKGGGGTGIEHASASYTIRGGVMHTNNLSVSTGSIDATGTGSVNLPARTLDFRIEPKLIAGIVTVPVIVSGPWDHPSFQPDVAGIAKGIISAPVNVIGGAGGGVSKAGQGVGGALKSLFGN